MFNLVARQTHYTDTIETSTNNDLPNNFDIIDDKASNIENWINNLTLLNQNVQTDTFNYEMNISLFSDEEQVPVKDHKIERQIFNITQIANSR